MRRLHIVLLALAIAAGTNAWAQRGGGGHGGGGGRGGGGGGFHGGGGGFRGGYGGGGFRGGYRGGHGGWGYGRGYGYRGGWGYGRGFGLGWWPWAYWPGPYYGYYEPYGYPYYSYYPSYSYPYYSSSPCYPYGPYDCRISGYGPTAYAPDPAPAGPNPAAYSQRNSPPVASSQMTASPVTRTAYVGDGQWHHFGPQPAPAMRASSPQSAPHSQTSEPRRTYNVSVAEAR